jgi:hypothetical protein
MIGDIDPGGEKLSLCSKLEQLELWVGPCQLERALELPQHRDVDHICRWAI